MKEKALLVVVWQAESDGIAGGEPDAVGRVGGCEGLASARTKAEAGTRLPTARIRVVQLAVGQRLAPGPCRHVVVSCKRQFLYSRSLRNMLYACDLPDMPVADVSIERRGTLKQLHIIDLVVIPVADASAERRGRVEQLPLLTCQLLTSALNEGAPCAAII